MRSVAGPGEGERSPAPSGASSASTEGARARAATSRESCRLVRFSAERPRGPSRACHGEGNRQRETIGAALDLSGVEGGADSRASRAGGAGGEDAAGGAGGRSGELRVPRVSAQEVPVGAVSRPDVLAAMAGAEEHEAASGAHSRADGRAAQRGEGRASRHRAAESRAAGLGELLSHRECPPEVQPDRLRRAAAARAVSGPAPRSAGPARGDLPVVVRLAQGAWTSSVVRYSTLSRRCACLTPRDHREAVCPKRARTV